MSNSNLTIHILSTMIDDSGPSRAEVNRSRGFVKLERFWNAAETMAHKKDLEHPSD